MEGKVEMMGWRERGRIGIVGMVGLFWWVSGNLGLNYGNGVLGGWYGTRT